MYTTLLISGAAQSREKMKKEWASSTAHYTAARLLPQATTELIRRAKRQPLEGVLLAYYVGKQVHNANTRWSIPMSSLTYEEVLTCTSQLSTDEQLQLLADLAAPIRNQSKMRPPESILEYEGVAKDAWAGIDAQEYVNQERDSWGG